MKDATQYKYYRHFTAGLFILIVVLMVLSKRGDHQTEGGGYVIAAAALWIIFSLMASALYKQPTLRAMAFFVLLYAGWLGVWLI